MYVEHTQTTLWWSIAVEFPATKKYPACKHFLLKMIDGNPPVFRTKKQAHGYLKATRRKSVGSIKFSVIRVRLEMTEVRP